MDGVLDDELANGVLQVETRLRPAIVARALAVDNWNAAVTDVRWACQLWGGAADLLVPVDGQEIPDIYGKLLATSELDALTGVSVPSTLAPHLARSRLRRLPAIVALSRSDRSKLRVLEVCEVAPDSPWSLAYLATLGHLPEIPDPVTLQDLFLPADLAFDQFVEVQRVEVVDPGPADLLVRMRSSATFSPTTLSRHRLASKGFRTRHSALDGWVADPRSYARQNPGAVVVIYKPTDVADLCLLWNLRAMHGWGGSHPLGVPWLDDVTTTVDTLKVLIEAVDPAITGWPLTLTSASLTQDELSAIAEELSAGGQTTDVAGPDDLLMPATPPARVAAATVTFTSGAATIQTRTDRDRHELELLTPLATKPDVRLSIRLPGRFLPPTHSLAPGRYRDTTAAFVGGSLVVDASKDELRDIRWPAGFTLLKALAADRGIAAAPSASGRTAMALLASLGSLHDIAWLAHRPLLTLLYKKAASAGMTWWKQRATDLAKIAAEATSDPDKVIQKLSAAISDVSVSHGGESAATLTFGELCQALGNKHAATRWLEWAERRSLLVRGTKVKCPRCQHEDWRPLSDIAPPIVCPGCGRGNDRPFGESSLTFTFRLGEPLRRALEGDSIHHLLAMRTIALLLGTGPDPLVGVHPGVDFTKGDFDAEADVVAVLASGAVVVAETKARSTGLKQHDLDQLDILAGWFDSTTVLLTTGDDDSQLTTDFLAAARSDLVPWRRLLSADDILERFPSVTFNSRLPGPDVCQDGDSGPRTATAVDHDLEFATGILASQDLAGASPDGPTDPTASHLA